jgi:citrate lyase gamma subunit
MVDKQIGARNTSVILQANATSTVAGAECEITDAGRYRFYVEEVTGTLDTSTPQLFVKPKNASSAKVYYDKQTGEAATITSGDTSTTGAASIELKLCAGDIVNSQNTVVGGTYNYNAILSKIE